MHFITLPKVVDDAAVEVGVRRQRDAEAKHRAAHNNAPTNHDDALALNIMGARCEAAAVLFFRPVLWHALKPRIHRLPDLDTFIDVKGVDKPTHKMIVQENDPPEWAYVLVDGHAHPRYEIVGWCWGHAAQNPIHWVAQSARIRGAAYFINRFDGVIDDVDLLTPILRERQRRAA